MGETRADPIAEILPGRLYKSGCMASLGDAEKLGINAIVCVGDSELTWLGPWRARIWTNVGRDDPRRAFYVRAPLIDAEGMLDANAAEAAAGVVTALLTTKGYVRTVLVHCDMGAFRSVLVASLAYADITGRHPIQARMAVQAASGRRHEPRGEWMREFESYLESARPEPTGEKR